MGADLRDEQDTALNRIEIGFWPLTRVNGWNPRKLLTLVNNMLKMRLFSLLISPLKKEMSRGSNLVFLHELKPFCDFIWKALWASQITFCGQSA